MSSNSACTKRDHEQQESYSDEMLEAIFDELFPICRSITGPGLRASLDIFGRYMPLQREQVPSGTQVFDWTVPQEWHIEGATLTAPDGSIVADFNQHNLHVVNYSEAVDKRLSLEELQSNLYSLPHLPNAIPYVTSYYQRNWGFCLTHQVRENLPEGEYHAQINSRFVDGGVDFAHTLLEGESDREVLLSSYLCHPSMANNERSGPLVLLGLYHRLKKWPRRRYSYRFLLNPETIGSLCFLHRHHQHLADKLEAGLVLTCLGGDQSSLIYKESRIGNGLIDKVFRHIDSNSENLNIRPFTPEGGSDERQYCSPGFNFPVGNIARSAYGNFPGYHNSLDTKEFMDIKAIRDSIDKIESWLKIVEVGATYINTTPYGEPHLSKYDLYPAINSAESGEKSSDSLKDGRQRLALILQVLSHCDGNANIVDLADKLTIPLQQLRPIVETLEYNGLLKHKKRE